MEKSNKSADVAKTVRTLAALEDYKPAGEFKKAMIEEFEMIKTLFKTAVPPSSK